MNKLPSGLSELSSPKSMKTCLDSEPQIPVNRVLAITHCWRDGWGWSSSINFIGVRANPTRSGFDSSGAVHASGLTPYSSPFTTPTTNLSGSVRPVASL